MKYIYDNIISDIENTKLNKINNNIYLSNNHIEVLKKYNIDYLKCSNIQSLLFEIEEILNNELFEDLEEVSIALQEFNYYNNTNK